MQPSTPNLGPHFNNPFYKLIPPIFGERILENRREAEDGAVRKIAKNQFKQSMDFRERGENASSMDFRENNSHATSMDFRDRIEKK